MRFPAFIKNHPAISGFVVGAVFTPFFAYVTGGILGSLQERAAFPMNQARIELVRSTLTRIPCDGRVLAYSPWVGEGKDWNVRIAYEHEAQQHWYSRYLSPASWLQVPLIPVPCEDKAL